LVDTTDPEEKWRIAVVRIDSSDTSRTGDTVRRILSEVVACVLHRTIELRLEAWFGSQLACGDWAKQLCTTGAEIPKNFNLLHFELRAGQCCFHFKSEAEAQPTHKYMAGVVYRNDSDVETVLADPLAWTSVVARAKIINESIASRSIV